MVLGRPVVEDGRRRDGHRQQAAERPHGEGDRAAGGEQRDPEPCRCRPGRASAGDRTLRSLNGVPGRVEEVVQDDAPRIEQDAGRDQPPGSPRQGLAGDGDPGQRVGGRAREVGRPHELEVGGEARRAAAPLTFTGDQ